MKEEIKILSVNVRGLATATKRRDIFKWLKEHKADIYCLQDVHCKPALVNYWAAEWGYKSIYAPYRGDSRGTAILFNNTFEFKVHQEENDPFGNFNIVNIEMGGKKITLVNLYGPNKDNPEFYKNIEAKIEEGQNISVIICGDWNLVLDQEQDTSGYLHENNVQAQKQVLTMKENLNLIDAWRANNPDVKRFTWRQSGQSLKQSRLDFFLISEDLYNQTSLVDIKASYKSDHSPVQLNIKPFVFTHGKGFWKFNTTLLHDKQYVEKVKDKVTEIINQYKGPAQNEVERADMEFIIDDQLFWETLKMEIRKMTISYSGLKKRERLREEKELVEEINRLEKELSENPSADIKENLQEKQTCLEHLREVAIKSIMIRSRARWVEQGERPTSYFCNLEKRNYCNKTLPFIESGDRIITDQKEILTEQTSFYKDLYSSKYKEGPIESFFLDTNIDSLSEEQKQQCEGPVSEPELKNVLRAMANNKSPGTDGFPAEFFKFFWSDIGCYLLRSFKHAYNLGRLSITQRRGIITCLPKGDKPRQYLKNWRPITLLNVDYKIFSACLAGRLKQVLPSIISSSQKGFLSGRFIGENTRLVLDIMQHLEEQQKSGMILLADFEKAFDSIEWPYLNKLLKTYNFGESFQKWFSILYNGAESCVINNGHFSQFFDLGRGCRQGDPLSPYIFILAIEPLAMALKNNKEIQGIRVGDIEYKVGMYADDTFLLLKGDEHSMRVAVEMFKKFHLCSGLGLNEDKTQVAWLGEKRGSPERLVSEFELNWTTSFTLLGIRFSTLSADGCVDINLQGKIKEISNVLNRYKHRNLTIMGKVTVIKTLAIPKLVHVLTVIPNPKPEFFTRINELFALFLWNNKKGKVNRNLLAQGIEEGGLKLTHLESQANALKIRWIRALLLEDDELMNIFETITGLNTSRVLCLDPRSITNITKKIKNNFWKDTLNAWAGLVQSYKINQALKIIGFGLWDSWFIQNENLNILKEELTFRGCFLVGHLYDEEMKLLSHENFCSKYMRINFLDFTSLQLSVPTKWKRVLALENYKPDMDEPELVQCITMEPKTCRYAYKYIIESLEIKKPHEAKWREKGVDITDEEWKQYNLVPFKSTKSTKLQALQYKITHRILGTKTYQKQCNIIVDDVCTFCATGSETLTHLFVDCPVVKTFWDDICIWMENGINLKDILDSVLILFGDLNSALISHIVLVAKQYIFLCERREQRPSLQGYKAMLLAEYKTEEQIAKGKKSLYKTFREKWKALEHILDENPVS